jgi:hypothetical protein
LPPAAGFDAVVKLYCFLKLAVYVAGPWGVVTVWLCVWPSLQPWYTYRVPASPPFVCGEATSIVWRDPGAQPIILGVVYVAPSTITDNPAGSVVNVYATLKFAVSDFAPLITSVPTAPPGSAPEPGVTVVPVQLAKAYAALTGAVVAVTAWFNPYQLRPFSTSIAAGLNVNVPAPEGFTNPVTACWVPNVAVYVVAAWGVVIVWLCAPWSLQPWYT